jgi:hypothetical protein
MHRKFDRSEGREEAQQSILGHFRSVGNGVPPSFFPRHIKFDVFDLFALMLFEQFDRSVHHRSAIEDEGAEVQRHQGGFRVHLATGSKKCQTGACIVREFLDEGRLSVPSSIYFVIGVAKCILPDAVADFGRKAEQRRLRIAFDTTRPFSSFPSSFKTSQLTALSLRLWV